MGQINYKLAINLPQYLESISKRPLLYDICVRLKF